MHTEHVLKLSSEDGNSGLFEMAISPSFSKGAKNAFCAN